MEIACELARIVINEGAEGQVIFLREREGRRAFPIMIGIYEAYAIHRKINRQETPRPLTHDLLASVIKEMGGRLERIVVTELRNETFYARLHIQLDGAEVTVDSRPSDAIALAVQLDAEIFVEDEVLDQVAHYEMPSGDDEKGDSGDA